jgi:hypothetical protein
VPHVLAVGQFGEHHVQPVYFHEVHDLEGQVVGVVEELDGSGLEEHCFEVLEGLGEADHDEVGAHLQQGVGDEVVVFRYCDEVVGEVLLVILEGYHGALGEYLGHSSLQCLLRLPSLVAILGHSFLHLVRSLQLLHYYQFIA